MLVLKYLSVAALAVGTYAQGNFNARENSAAVLKALQAADATTITSGQAAAAYNAADRKSDLNLRYQNQVLLANWQTVLFTANAAQGFYDEAGAQAIIDFVNNKLYPDTRDADQIYVARRPDFVASGFSSFINSGLLRLRRAVDASGAAISARTRAKQLTAISEAFLLVEQDYATTQEIQQNGSA